MSALRPRTPGIGLALLALVASAGTLFGASGCKTARTAVPPELPTWQKRPGWVVDVAGRRQLTVVSNTTDVEDQERGRAELDPAHNRVFVGSSDHGLYALAADTLSTLWRFQTLGVVQSEPLYEPQEDVVYFGSHDGALYKVRAKNGELVWRFSSNAEVARKPVLANGLLYFVNANDTIVAIDPQSGKLRWSQHRSPAYGMEIAGHAGVSVLGNLAFASFSDGHVYAFDALDGSERWSVDLAAEAESVSGDQPQYLDADATPIPAKVDGGWAVFVASYAGGVHALDAETGARVWANERALGVTDLTVWEQRAHTPRDGGPAIPTRRALLASSGTTGLWALDLNDGHDLWRRSLPEGGVSPPVAIAGALLVSTTRYGLFLLSPLDGNVIDGIETGSGFSMTPAAFQQRAFVMTNQGVLMSLRIETPPSAL